MRVYYRRSGRGCLRAWLLLGLLAAAVEARGQGGSPPSQAPSTDSIILSADRVRYWDVGPSRWVLLEGRAAVFQGPDGLRAAQVAARVDERQHGGVRTFAVEVYAEGDATLTERPGEVLPSLRVRHATQADVQIRAHPEGIMTRLVRQPDETPVLDRAFPDRADAVTPAATADSPEGAETAHAPAPIVAPASTPSTVDSSLRPAQFDDGEGFPSFPAIEMPQEEPGPATEPDRSPGFDEAPLPSRAAETLPGPELLVPPSEAPPREVVVEEAPPVDEIGPAPLLPSSRRIVTISPRDSGPNFAVELRPSTNDSGLTVILIRGGVNLVAEAPGQGIIDVSADSAVIWTRLGGGTNPAQTGTSRIDVDPRQPFEVYLEGNVLFKQDQREVAGDGDQKNVEAQTFYMDMRNEWFVAQHAQLTTFNSQFMTPIKTQGVEIRQYRPILRQTEQGPIFGPAQIRAEQATITGSRFPTPGYRFRSRSVDLTQLDAPLIDPTTGRPVADPSLPGAPRDKVWRIDARQNVFFLGPVPIFYWPRFLADSDDLDPPLRQIQYRYNNYFGHQALTDWSMFKLLGVRRPHFIDDWNLDLDYLSERGFAAGSEVGWAGRDLIGNLTDPYNRRGAGRSVDRPYTGYFNIWGLKDSGIDVLGGGPAIVTANDAPPDRVFGREKVPPFQDFRGRVLLRHMQSFVPSDEPFDHDFRLQLEGAYVSDRHFLEQYYKRLFDSGLDQKTLAYLIHQRENTAWTVLGSANLQDWYTDTQWLPRLDYYRLGDSLLGDIFTYWQNSGVSYANTHTAVETNDPDLFPNAFLFLPFDPVSATSGPFRTGRLWTSHELNLPLDLGFLRLVPYAQGQLVGWDNQYETALPPIEESILRSPREYIRGPQGSMLGRAWGGLGARANVMAWRVFPGVESERLNLHGLSHKINFDADFRAAYSTVELNRIGIQDELDTNTYEFVRRYFALTNYIGGVLPAQYDPRLLTLRRSISPITGTTDVQGEITTLDLAIRQRLQTRRGPEGRRRIVDIMTLDLSTTYFPNGSRDNFGKAFGQNMYNWEWFVGDRTSFVSYGWFEFFDIAGRPILASNPRHTNDPFGLRVITSGISINRPPRGNVFIGYSVINTGPIATSALNLSCSYWLSPKWYSSFGTSYDFGNAILLSSTVGITRIGADWLTSVGLTVDPQRNSYMFGFELTPRLSPSIRFGSGGGVARVDSRFAAVE